MPHFFDHHYELILTILCAEKFDDQLLNFLPVLEVKKVDVLHQLCKSLSVLPSRQSFSL